MLVTATSEDIAAVTGLASALWPGHDAAELREEMLEAILDENAVIALCLEDGTPAGFAQCGLRFDYVEGTASSPVGYLEGIYVSPDRRRRGIAESLLRYCESWAREKGCAEFASDCELDNAASYFFHMSEGFTEANRIICFKKAL